MAIRKTLFYLSTLAIGQSLAIELKPSVLCLDVDGSLVRICFADAVLGRLLNAFDASPVANSTFVILGSI